MQLNVIQYEHHGKTVSVQEHLKGKHREHCLCFTCEKFKPSDTAEGRGLNCPIANAVFENCVKFNIVSPVWECPEYVAKAAA